MKKEMSSQLIVLVWQGKNRHTTHVVNNIIVCSNNFTHDTNVEKYAPYGSSSFLKLKNVLALEWKN